MANSVQVAVRVRPFNDREKQLGAKLCVEMVGSQTFIWDLDAHRGDRAAAYKKKRTFNFDYSFWSHKSEDQHFVTNKAIFQDMGMEVLKQCWNGFNVSLFAYGQTGSGKSYSMIGYGEDGGVVPLACREIFRRIEEQKAKYVSDSTPPKDQIAYVVQASMIEIYNEKVRDLFNARNSPPGGLMVREDPKTGPYVKDLTNVTVNSAAEILKWLDVGNTNKTIGETKMNKTSSRAHTLFTIYLKFTRTEEFEARGAQRVRKIDVTSKLNLVDLAGSEKLGNTGATGARMREGININKSLSALGNCIKALADMAEGKKVHVPFRDSVLTKIMKQSLGGNSKTIMIAAVSPASSNYTESLSTLRYADRAKKIKCKAVRNEDAREKKIRLLTEEVKKLKRLLAQAGLGDAADLEDGAGDEESAMIKQLREQLEAQKAMMAGASESDDDAAKRTQLLMQQNEAHFKSHGLDVGGFDRKTVVHLVNLNEDPLSDAQLLFPLRDAEIVVGKRKAGNADAEEEGETSGPAIGLPLDGLGITPHHAVFRLGPNPDHEGESKVTIHNGNTKGDLFVNGEPVLGGAEGTVLTFGDRIIIGATHVFKFVNPVEYSRLHAAGSLSDGAQSVSWEMAKKEVLETQNRALLEAQERDMKEKMAAMEADIAAKAAEAEEEMQKEKAALADQMAAMRAELAEKEADGVKSRELDAQKKALEEQLAEQQRQFADKQAEMEDRLKLEKDKARIRVEKEAEEQQLLEASIMKLLPLVKECNFITEELKKPQKFELKIIRTADGVSKVNVNASNTETNRSSLWAEDRFIDQMYRMKEEYENYVSSVDAGVEYEPSYDPHDNPFQVVAPGEPQLVGRAMVFLQSLANLMSTEMFTGILDFGGSAKGQLKVALMPCRGPEFVEDTEEEMFVETPEELLGTSIRYKIKVICARGLDPKMCTDAYVRFKVPFGTEQTEWVSSDPAEVDSINPEWDYAHNVTTNVTKEVLEYFQETPLAIEVFASYESGGKKKKRTLRTVKACQAEIRDLEEKMAEIEGQAKYHEQQVEEEQRKNLILSEEVEELKRKLASGGGDDDGSSGLYRELADAKERAVELEAASDQWKKKYDLLLQSKTGDSVSQQLKKDNDDLQQQLERVRRQQKQNAASAAASSASPGKDDEIRRLNAELDQVRAQKTQGSKICSVM